MSGQLSDRSRGLSTGRILGTFHVPLLCAILALSCAEEPAPSLDQALNLYSQNKLEEALPLLERVAEREERNAEALAFLAETYRRLDKPASAIVTARKAIDLDPCNTFAHTVLAAAHNPMYGSWENADPDITWRHLRQAAECDSTDGNVWIWVWTEAGRRGDRLMEKRALRLLVETGFLTPALLSYNRWMMRHLPDNALLVTNGDWDTYPAVALQQVEAFRPDVAVVNRSLLNVTWYTRYLRDRYELSFPFREEKLATLSARRDASGKISLVSDQILQGWLDMARAGEMTRPIAVSVTVDKAALAPEVQEGLQFAGPFWLWLPEGEAVSPQDTTLLRTSLASVNPEDFSGSLVSPDDRSPVRMTQSNRLVENISAASLRYCESLIESGLYSEASEMLTWTERFQEKTLWGAVFPEQIANLKEAARQGAQ